MTNKTIPTDKQLKRVEQLLIELTYGAPQAPISNDGRRLLLKVFSNLIGRFTDRDNKKH